MTRALVWPLTVEIRLGESPVEGQRFASIYLGEVEIFTELVFDNSVVPAEHNIVRLFASRLRAVLETS